MAPEISSLRAWEDDAAGDDEIASVKTIMILGCPKESSDDHSDGGCVVDSPLESVFVSSRGQRSIRIGTFEKSFWRNANFFNRFAQSRWGPLHKPHRQSRKAYGDTWHHHKADSNMDAIKLKVSSKKKKNAHSIQRRGRHQTGFERQAAHNGTANDMESAAAAISLNQTATIAKLIDIVECLMQKQEKPMELDVVQPPLRNHCAPSKDLLSPPWSPAMTPHGSSVPACHRISAVSTGVGDHEVASGADSSSCDGDAFTGDEEDPFESFERRQSLGGGIPRSVGPAWNFPVLPMAKSGAAWEWPLNREETKARLSLIDQEMMSLEREELLADIANLRNKEDAMKLALESRRASQRKSSGVATESKPRSCSSNSSVFRRRGRGIHTDFCDR